MSGAAITPSMRAVGWNVHFMIGQEEDPGAFAGIYQVPESNLVTFRQVCDELSLCFEFPDEEAHGESEHDNQNATWANVAFALADDSDVSGWPSLVTEQKLHQPVLSLPPLGPKEQNVLRYQIVRHENCRLPDSPRLEAHLQAKCARHLPSPVRRRDPRYLPPNESLSDSRLTITPLRRKLKARAQSPPKRSASGSLSPRKDGSGDMDDDEFDSMLAPASMKIDLDEARRVTNEFRSSCLNRATCCAVSGEGEPWCPGPSIGPAVQACHVVPQQHYHLYPSSTSGQHADDHGPIEDSPRRLQEAWQRTWSPRNGILLMKHLHEFFDARLFSIHPQTLRVRVFVPYNALIRFNGQKASVPATMDRKALRHHYEMCCIENMAAERPNLDAAPTGTSRMATSGTNTPLSARTDFPATPSSRGIQMETVVGAEGDPAKRSRPLDHSHGGASGQHDGEGALWEDVRGSKRRRSDADDEFPRRYEDYSHLEGHITPRNNREFLARVNSKLRRCRT